MRLSDIVSDIIEQHDRPGVGINMHAATKALVLAIEADPEHRSQLLWEAAGKRIKAAATAARKEAEGTDENCTQLPLLANLRPRYALDGEDRVVKRTEDLTRLELRRVIQIRRDQIKHDVAHLDALVKVEADLAAVWDLNPAMTLGQCALAAVAAGIAAE